MNNESIVHVEKLKRALQNLQDAEVQKRLWLSTGGEVSSLVEMACQAFDDTGLTDAIEDGSVSKQFDQETIISIDELSRALDAVDLSLPVLQLLTHPKMDIVRNRANHLLSQI